MHDFKRIRFAYFPPRAEIHVVSWCLKGLDLKLAEAVAIMMISDVKLGWAGLEISGSLTGAYPEELGSKLEQKCEWICRKATQCS